MVKKTQERKRPLDPEQTDSKLSPPPAKRIRKSTSVTIADLPNEMILQIFSSVPKLDMHWSVRFVCERWSFLAMDPLLWKRVDIDSKTPTKVFNEWIKNHSQMKHFFASNRTDLDNVLQKISRNCKELETIKIVNCWGSQRHYIVHSGPLCNLMLKCTSLRKIHFDSIIFKSCKFFKLLAEDRSKKRAKRISYNGPMTLNQFTTYILSTKDQDLENKAQLGTPNRMFKLQDILNLLKNHPTVQPDAVIGHVWSALNEGAGEQFLRWLDENLP